MKKVTDLKEREVIHCKTEQEAKVICKLMHDAGLEWCNDETYLERNHWVDFKEKTCYCPMDGSFANLSFYKEANYIIHPASHFIENQYPKVMLVNDSDNIKTAEKRVVFMEKCGKYIAWAGAETLEEAEKETRTFPWNYAWDIPEVPEYTIEELIEKIGHNFKIKK